MIMHEKAKCIYNTQVVVDIGFVIKAVSRLHLDTAMTRGLKLTPPPPPHYLPDTWMIM